MHAQWVLWKLLFHLEVSVFWFVMWKYRTTFCFQIVFVTYWMWPCWFSIFVSGMFHLVLFWDEGRTPIFFRHEHLLILIANQPCSGTFYTTRENRVAFLMACCVISFFTASCTRLWCINSRNLFPSVPTVAKKRMSDKLIAKIRKRAKQGFQSYHTYICIGF